ncbi:hybrid sensor histidine kinase/response regulator [Bacillus infantis]|uniref:histidine kinase n=1 Tax=Bacillus infantis TaxID=324767 RepID=A0A5D4SDN7_9BACI|nr:ATP-binding protein [Bacillus infantis]TYS60428.1 response regulator [Bacillus infantis]
MKINDYFKKSLSRQFAGLMGVFIFFFIAGTIVLVILQQNLSDSYNEKRAELVKKEALVQEIDSTFNRVFFDVRGYLAFDNDDMRISAQSKQPELRKMGKQLDELAASQDDKAYAREVREFIDYYFIEKLPATVNYFETGRIEEVKRLASTGATARVNTFQDDSLKYLQGINDQLNEEAEGLMEKQSYIQMGFVLFSFVILVLLARITRVMFRRVGQPLADFAAAANEIAAGREAVITVESSREDELGALSVAFQKMVWSVQDKEQDLTAQNEELLAQQDELQAQQTELEEMLEALRENELKLKRRNDLTNGISSSLDLQSILDSIVVNMCGIISADRGMIGLLNTKAAAAYAISASGVEQFMDHIENGLHERLIQSKKSFAIKRELLAGEKGYHEEVSYSYDLYLPVISSKDEVIAVMLFSRFGSPFSEKQMDEYEALSRQVGISLDNISLYSQSEEERKLNKDILNTVQEGIQMVSRSGAILQANRQLEEMFTCPGAAGRLENLPWEIWSAEMANKVEQPDEFLAFLQNAVHSDSCEMESIIYQMKQTGQVIKMYCEGLGQEDERIGTVLVHRDITKEFEVDQMKSEFVSTVSHELRTPLASILGFTELMLNRELKPDKQKKYLTTIYNEARRLTSLINDFLDVQRMEAGKQTYEKKYLRLLPIIEQVIEKQQINTDIHKIKIDDRSIGNDVILGDKSKVEQVFTNLISNAVKYSPGGGDIIIRLYQEDKSVLAEVEDKGLGIPEDALDKLFTKFYRVDNSDRRRIGGTGLGLSIVQEIMKAHSGSISVASSYGKGSIFTLSFPLIETAEEPGAISVPKASAEGYRVMVVEDDQSLAELIIQELSDSGFQVVHYKRGQEALDFLARHTPDAIVLDIMLEEEQVDGWRIMEQIKENDRLKNIPIIVSTALDEKEKGFSLGANDYLVKPYKPSQLSRAIMQTLLKIGKVGQILIPEK